MDFNQFKQYVESNLTPYVSKIYIEPNDMIHALNLWDTMKIGDKKFETDPTDNKVKMRIEYPAVGSIIFIVK